MMDMSGDDKENKEAGVNKYSAERSFHGKVQRNNDEVIASEVDDFVREIIEAVAYIIDHRKTPSRRIKRAIGEHMVAFEISDTDSITGNSRKKKALSVPHGNEPAHRYRKITVKQLAEQEKRMEERRKIAAEKMYKRDAVIGERRRQKEEIQKQLYYQTSLMFLNINTFSERSFHGKVQRNNDEVIASEVDDFVREIIEAVAYIIDHRKTPSRRIKRAIGEHMVAFEISDTDSITGNSRKKKALSVPHGNEPAHRYRKITVKQLAEQEKRMEERRKIAAEKMYKRDAVIGERRRQKEEIQKEKERLKREQKEARERKRKEELRKKEQRKKEEEERKEQKRIEEEVRRQRKQKEEEEREKKRREEEAIQLKKRRESDRFLSFFDKKEKTERGSEALLTSSVLNVLPFFCKQGVSLAPTFRRKPLSKEVHDNLLLDVQHILVLNSLLINPLQERPYLSTIKPPTVGKIKLNRAKLFQFHDNWRPPYYGTWRKRSTVITGRKPFAKDSKMLDYEVDSDEEWEIPEGDDCDQSTASEEDEEDSDHSIDNDGFIVQHGYLSEGEGEDEQDRLEYHEDSNKRAERLRAVANEWEHNLEQKSKKFSEPLIPLLWGPHFELPAKGIPEEVEQAVFFEYSDDDDDVAEDDYDHDDNNDDDGSSDNGRDDIFIED
ncbi:hypothetical protein X798_00277 [Onchocerca flexuosa]|uniref:Chromatin assembly factor 1 subunit A dimerization domain-containing protein n=1 Tax=Onchocerca flexuosa TaxID=387005 RepID=A0A238C5V8_9BILA|nr:hypothetical protein X798_00277 [Onchocerca flexuosa]